MPMINTPQPCPDDERLAALIDGRLRRGERRQTLRHLGGCAACRRVLSLAAGTLAAGAGAGGGTPVVPFRPPAPRRWILAAAAVLVLGVGAGVLVRSFLPTAGNGPSKSAAAHPLELKEGAPATPEGPPGEPDRRLADAYRPERPEESCPLAGADDIDLAPALPSPAGISGVNRSWTPPANPPESGGNPDALRLQVDVTDPGGIPLMGAALCAFRRGTARPAGEIRREHLLVLGRTNAVGRFDSVSAVAGLAPGRHRLRVVCGGFRPFEGEVDLPRPDTGPARVRVILEPEQP